MTETDAQRQALGVFMVALCTLLESCGLSSDSPTVDNVSVNFDGRFRRVDIATLNAEGRLQEVVVSLSADPSQPGTFAQPIGLPWTAGPVQ